MEAFTSSINGIFGILTMLAEVLSAALLVAIFSEKARRSSAIAFLASRPMLVAFIAALLATAGSLTYSDIIGYEPCKLCWFQRIFMYPQVILLGIALWRKDASLRLYSLVLSIIGGAIALFHYVGQLGYNPFALDCLAIGYSSACAKQFVLQYGYITIPLMSLSAFVLMILVHLASYRSEKDAAAPRA